MRKFLVYIGYPFAGAEDEEEILEFDDAATKEQIDKECGDCLDTMISNCLDTGWFEIENDEPNHEAVEHTDEHSGKVCLCRCREDQPSCEHIWDGPERVSDDSSERSATCSRCNMTVIDHDFFVTQ